MIQIVVAPEDQQKISLHSFLYLNLVKCSRLASGSIPVLSAMMKMIFTLFVVAAVALGIYEYGFQQGQRDIIIKLETGKLL